MVAILKSLFDDISCLFECPKLFILLNIFAIDPNGQLPLLPWVFYSGSLDPWLPEGTLELQGTQESL